MAQNGLGQGTGEIAALRGGGGAVGTQGEVLVRLAGLSKGYEEGGQEHLVLDQVSQGFRRGAFVALLGKSGSGKSTLLNMIAGIDQPKGGDVWIGDVALTRLRERERTLFRRDHIGFIFQFFNLIPTLTVLENVTLPLELAGQPAAQVEVRAMTLLERVGLAARRDSFPERLSGGEQQRVAIARALAPDPLLLLADEPTGNLDEETSARVLALLLEMQREAGKTLIMATHSLEIAGHADEVYRIHEGHLMAENSRGYSVPTV